MAVFSRGSLFRLTLDPSAATVLQVCGDHHQRADGVTMVWVRVLGTHDVSCLPATILTALCDHVEPYAGYDLACRHDAPRALVIAGSEAADDGPYGWNLCELHFEAFLAGLAADVAHGADLVVEVAS